MYWLEKQLMEVSECMEYSLSLFFRKLMSIALDEIVFGFLDQLFAEYVRHDKRTEVLTNRNNASSALHASTLFVGTALAYASFRHIFVTVRRFVGLLRVGDVVTSVLRRLSASCGELSTEAQKCSVLC